MMVKLVLTDIDGVWTDGGIYLDETNNEFKKFHSHDSTAAVLLRLINIPIGIITGEQTKLVARRAEKLKIDIVHMGVVNKLEVATQIVNDLGLKWEEVAYIGDDIIDIPLLEKVGLSACPNTAPLYVKDKADWVMNNDAGQAVFREFIENLLVHEGLWEKAYEAYMERITNHS